MGRWIVHRHMMMMTCVDICVSGKSAYLESLRNGNIRIMIVSTDWWCCIDEMSRLWCELPCIVSLGILINCWAKRSRNICTQYHKITIYDVCIEMVQHMVQKDQGFYGSHVMSWLHIHTENTIIRLEKELDLLYVWKYYM